MPGTYMALPFVLYIESGVTVGVMDDADVGRGKGAPTLCARLGTFSLESSSCIVAEPLVVRVDFCASCRHSSRSRGQERP